MPKKKKPKKERKQKPPITFQISEQFEKDYLCSSEEVQNEVDSALRKLTEHGDFIPSMKPAKLIDDIWYIRASRGTRITFSYLNNNIIFLRRCGPHSIIDKNKKQI